MMKKIAIVFAIIALPAFARADANVDGIIARFNAAMDKARAHCSGLEEKIDHVKIMAGVSVGAGALGTIGGTAGAVLGVKKAEKDEDIAGMEYLAQKKVRARQLLAKFYANTLTSIEAAEMITLTLYIANNIARFREMDNGMAAAKKTSQTLGGLRTAGSFVGAAGGAAGAATSLSGAKILDEIVADMNACDSYRNDIERLSMEIRFSAEPENPAAAQMNKIAADCKGMNSKNIIDVKKKMTAAGVISIIGAAAGAAGGITSAVAAGNEKGGAPASKNGNVAATVLSGVSGAGNAVGAIISGVALAGLVKNGEIAKKCGEAF